MRLEEQIKLEIWCQCGDCDAQYRASVPATRGHYQTLNPCPCGSSRLIVIGVKLKTSVALDLVCAAAGLQSADPERVECDS